MADIEERAKVHFPDAFDADYILPAREGYLVNIQRAAYRQGATEQKEIDDTLMSEERQKAFKIGYDIAVDEACKWVDDNVGTMTAIAFRKAME